MTKTHTANTPAARSAASQRTLSMTYTALFVVVMAVCSWITIPMTVPFTLQTFGVYMTLLLLGGRRGTLAIGIYLLLGTVGAPVFAGFAGGPGSLLGPTGGYLIGFLVMGLCYWLLISLLARGREESALWQHLAALLSLVMENSWRPSAQKHPAGGRSLADVKHYLDENFHKKITLDDLAERFYINKFYLARLFREQYGSSVINYLLYLRISRAKELLRFTEMTVEEIGARCGMPDANYFSRAFRKIEGMSPSEFRKLW